MTCCAGPVNHLPGRPATQMPNLLNGLAVHITVYADKGYDSRVHLSQRALKNGIIQKAQRGRPLSREQKIRNGRLAKVRHVEEQNFGTLRRKFRYAQTTYFGLNKEGHEAI